MAQWRTKDPCGGGHAPFLGESDRTKETQRRRIVAKDACPDAMDAGFSERERERQCHRAFLDCHSPAGDATAR